MRRIKQAKPSPALLVAVVALVAALGGGAVAGVAVTSLNKKETKKVRKIAKKKANEQIEKKAPGLNVNSAKTASSATTADSSTTADSARPFAYARITSAGNVTANVPSRNITSGQVSKGGTGIYCFDLSFTPTTGNVTGQAEDTSDDFMMIELAPLTLDGCPAGTEVAARNFDVSSGGSTNDDFYIQLSN